MLALCALTSVVAVTCDQQDFVVISPDLQVSSTDPARLLSRSDVLFFNGLYRLSLDFTLTNPSDQDTEVVVHAVSAVREDDDIERTVGDRARVFSLSAGQSRSERMSDLDLKSGTTFGVELLCCEASFCAPTAVDCPQPIPEGQPNAGECSLGPEICDRGCLFDGVYNLQCIIGCMSFYGRCCPDNDQLAAATEVPCCLETCAAQRCVAGQVGCAAGTDCSAFPTACFDGCPGTDPYGLDARCVASCVNVHAACCGDSAPQAPTELIPCCFEAGCDQLSRPVGQRVYCAAADTACAPQDACDSPEVCLSGCPSTTGGLDLECAGACMRQFNRCCGADGLPPFPAVEMPCCFAPCDQGSGRCPLADFSCPSNPFRCDAFPTTCVSGCLNDNGSPDLPCVIACFTLYEQCCDFSIPVDPNQPVPCCFSTHCAATMRGLVKLSSIECRDDAECGSGQFCNDRNLCESNVQDSQGSCALSPLRAPPSSRRPPWPLAVACALLLGLLCTRTRTRTRTRRARALLLPLLLVAALSLPQPARAADPLGFYRLRTTMGVGLSLSNWFLGDLGAYTQMGMGVALQQSIQYGYWGFGARIGIAYHLSDQPPLPFDRGFDAYHLAAGPRLYLPLAESLELALQPEYLFQGFGSNTLIQHTGGRDTLHGVGLWAGLHLIMGSLVIEAAAQTDYLPQTQTLILGGVLSVGIQGLL